MAFDRGEQLKGFRIPCDSVRPDFSSSSLFFTLQEAFWCGYESLRELRQMWSLHRAERSARAPEPRTTIHFSGRNDDMNFSGSQFSGEASRRYCAPSVGVYCCYFEDLSVPPRIHVQNKPNPPRCLGLSLSQVSTKAPRSER